MRMMVVARGQNELLDPASGGNGIITTPISGERPVHIYAGNVASPMATPTATESNTPANAGISTTSGSVTETPTPTHTPAPCSSRVPTPAAAFTASTVYGQCGSFTASTANLRGVSATSLNYPEGVAVDTTGDLSIADYANNRVLYFPKGSTTADAVYGQGAAGTDFTTNSPGASAISLNYPSSIALDSSGGLYAADTLNNRVLHFPRGSFTADAVYGQGATGSDFTDSNPGTSATNLYYPQGVAVDGSGGLYVADQGNNRVVYFPYDATAGKAAITAAAVYGQGASGTDFTDNNAGTDTTSLNGPTGVAVDSTGGLYVADEGNNRVLHFSQGSFTSDAVYGQGAGGTDFTDSNPGAGATGLNSPAGVAVDGSGGLYVADFGNNRVLHFPSGSFTAAAVYGQGATGSNFSGTSHATGATGMNGPTGVAVDSAGGLYVADQSNNRVLYFAPPALPTATPTSTPTVTATGASTPTATPTGTATQTTATIMLSAGWNLISLPLAPATPLDAQAVLTSLINTTHGSYAEMDGYSNGQFSPSLYDDPRDHLGIGTNFTLHPGQGYALYTSAAGSITVAGTPITTTTAFPLAAGWNLIGFPDAGANTYRAYDVLRALLAATHGRYVELDSYSNGRFSPSAYDDPGDGLGLGGTNFTVQPGQGYALYTDAATTLDL
jgi:sugar lactone lactonase YvrE